MTGRNRTLLKVAGFALLSMFLLGSLVVELGQVDLTDRYELSATFDDVQGLLEGDTVKLAEVWNIEMQRELLAKRRKQ